MSAAAGGFERRGDWVALLARLTDGFVGSIPPGGSPARAVLPGAPPRDPVPSIEGFARMSVAWGAWLHEPTNRVTLVHAGRRHDVARLVAEGLAAATDPRHAASWGPIGDRDQRIVEAAEMATGLFLGGARLRDALDAIDPNAFDRVLDWLGQVDGKDLWPDNWVLFPVLPALIRRSAGRHVDAAAMDRAIDWMVAHGAGDGWTRDGAGHALDLYSGWAIHWHLLWWAAIDGDRRPRLAGEVRRRARAWLRFVASLVADDGGFPRFGRSLGYRFAIAAPFAQAALLGIDPLPPGVARTLAGRLVRHSLAEGALDPETDWFRVGVAGARPAVVEAYVSAGASAWAAHALVALGLPAADPFWRAQTAAVHAARSSSTSAAAAAGLLAARSGGVTVLHNARTGHPVDIADHDYAATYGKLAYRSAFPFDVPVVPGQTAGSDDTLVALEGNAPGDDPGLAHRNESSSGTAGPRWITSRYALPTRGRTVVRTVVVLVGGVELRVHTVNPVGPIRLRDGGAALGVDADEPIWIERDEAAGLVAVVGGGRVVAVRALLGFDTSGAAEPGPGRMNLVHDRSLHPWVEESAASRQPRLVASATVAMAGRPGTGVVGLRSLRWTRPDQRTVTVQAGRGPDAETVRADLAGRPAQCAVVAGRTVRGPGLRVVVARIDGSAFAGERVREIDGVVSLARAGIVAVVRRDDAVDVTVAAGFRLEPAWAGPLGRFVRVRDGAAPFGSPVAVEEPGVVPDRLVRAHARRLGTRLVTLRLDRE